MTGTKIEWVDHTFNPWIGCQRVSPGCENCYAEAQVKRAPNLILGPGPHALLGRKDRLWGSLAPRKMTSTDYWKQPHRWNRAAEKAGERQRVFCASMADVFEDWRGDPDLDNIRGNLWALIERTPWLDWLLLTKRPENIYDMVPGHWIHTEGCAVRMHGGCGGNCSVWPRNAWVGCTVEDRRRAKERLPDLIRVPAPVRFVSYEPALEQVDFKPWLDRIQWLIVGGESGPGARPFDLAWGRSAAAQCKQAGVSVFVKQLGAHPCVASADVPRERLAGLRLVGGGTDHVDVILRDRKGGDMDEWPEDLRLREFPER